MTGDVSARQHSVQDLGETADEDLDEVAGMLRA